MSSSAFARIVLFGMVLASSTGCGAIRDRLSAMRHGCIAMAPRPTGADRLVEGTMHSRVLHRDVAYAIAYSSGPAGAILFALPGRGGKPHDLMTEIGFSRAVYAAHARPPFAVASVDGGESYWHRRIRGDDTAAMFAREFVPFAERLVDADAKRTWRGAIPEAIAGDSMGGYGAVARRQRSAPVRGNRRRFARNLEFVSGERRRCVRRRRRFCAQRRPAATGFAYHPLRIDRADNDPFEPGIAALAAFVPGSIVIRRPGCHDDAFFASAVDDEIRFVAAHLHAKHETAI